MSINRTVWPGYFGLFEVRSGFRARPQGVGAQIVPYATISVTTSATGVAATIYSDPGLTDQIIPPVLTADGNGMYQYYIPMNYMVTETISSPNQGSFVLPNIGENTEETLNLADPGPIGQGTFPQLLLGYHSLPHLAFLHQLVIA